MVTISDDDFHKLVSQAVADIPERYAAHLANVAFMTADVPTRQQLIAGGALHGRQVLLGLYEGIPLPRRNAGYNGVLPDIITVFRQAHALIARDGADMERLVHQTVWHEVAHYFGLDHGAISALERDKQ